jgi:phosphate transport system substrate-binding protein
LSERMRMLRAALSIPLLACGLASAQVPYEPHPAAPPRDAGYVMPDGTLRIVGWDDLAGIFRSLDALYERTHPGTRLAYVSADLTAPQHSIIFGETAFAPTGMEFSTGLNSAYRPLVKAPAFAIRIAHAAVQGDAKLGEIAFVVHPSNPLESVTPAQLLHIFTVGGRAPDTVWWKQAGVQGAFGEQEIHSYGLPESDHYPSEDVGFGPWLFRDRWGLAHNARNYSMQRTYADVVERVSRDPAGIGITTANRVTPGVKVLGVTPGEWGEPMRATRADAQSGRYPFDRFVYVYVRRGPRAPVDPFVKEYLRMVLSQEGQDIIAADAKGYLPLNRAELEAELAKLD